MGVTNHLPTGMNLQEPCPTRSTNRHLRLPKKWCAWPNAGDLSAPAEGPQMSIKVGKMKMDLYDICGVGTLPGP